jgi:hypothetical protein
MAGTGTRVHRHARCQRHQIEARQKAVAHLGVQHGSRIVGRGSAIERAPHPRGIECVGRDPRWRGIIAGAIH